MIMKPFTTSLRKTAVIVAVLCSVSVAAQHTNGQNMEDRRNAYQHYKDSVKAAYEKYKNDAYAEYEEYVRQARADYQAWHDSMTQTWGEEGDSVETTKTVWVEYSPDNNNRSIVDFDKGNVTVEVVVPEGGDESEVNAHLTAAIARMLNSRGSTCPYPSSVDKSEPLTHEPVLDGLLNLSEYEVDDEVPSEEPQLRTPPRPTVKGKNLNLGKKQSVKESPKEKGTSLASRKKKRKEQVVLRNANLAKAIAEQSPVTIKNVVGDDGKSRKVAQVQMAMVSDNLSKNAALYKDLVAEFSTKFDIEQPLIFAVIEQESRFNPQAKSSANACGLMQLVPKSGGRDANRYVNKKDEVPKESYLFNPRNNIELGTAYLRILTNQFAKVADDDCRRLCVIAGYNTGAGNVCMAFTGTLNPGISIPHINKHDYDSLYNHLTTNLSTEEARNYVVGVSKRREKYLK